MTINDSFTNELITPGAKVMHKEYGTGTISKLSTDKLYVSFNGRKRIFPYPDSFIKGYLTIIGTDIELVSSDSSFHPKAIASKAELSDSLANKLNDYFDHFPTRWENEKYLWKAVQTFHNHWDPDASDYAQMLKRATADADYLMNAPRYYPRDMIVGLAQSDPAYVATMFRSLFDENTDLAIRSEKFANDAEQIRTKYNGKFFGKNYQTMNAVSTYLWLMYPNKYYFYKHSVAQEVSSETGISYNAGRIPEAQKMIKQFALMDVISSILRKDGRSRMLLDPRLDQSLYNDDQLHCMAMDFAFFIRPCYKNRKEE